MTNHFNVGDRVRVIHPRPNDADPLRKDDIRVVRETRPSYADDSQVIYVNGSHTGYSASRFELVTDVSEAPRAPVLPGDIAFVVEVSHQGRSYDVNKGDERRFAQSAALKRAEERAIERGVRQQVRLGGPALAGGDPLWLIQDVA